MAKKVTITRKIKILIDGTKEEIKDSKFKLYKWNEIVFRAANIAATFQYTLDQWRTFMKMNFATVIKLVDKEKDPEGLLSCSLENEIYRILSDEFKGDVPMAMIAAANRGVSKNYRAEQKEYFSGKRSLRTYRRNIPMPAPVQMISNLKLLEGDKYGNYTFDFFKLKFKTFFGRDKSGNKIIFERAVETRNRLIGEWERLPQSEQTEIKLEDYIEEGGGYKLCDSSIQLDGKDIYLLAVFQFPSEKMDIGTGVMEAQLGMETPVIMQHKKKMFKVGDKEEFLYRRLQIQNGLRRMQIASRYNKGGKGIQKKIAGIDRWKDREKNYIQTRHHQYSKKMIDFCLQFKCGTLILKNQKQKEEEAKENPFILRNWSYYGLIDKIKYKCNKVGIELIIEDMKDDELPAELQPEPTE